MSVVEGPGGAGRYPFTNLVFEGGGVKGIAYAGALQVLGEAGVLPGVRAVAGTSAGAITAALVAVGYSPDELAATMLALDLTRFEDGGLEGPVRLVEKYGWYRGDAFLTWLRAEIETKAKAGDLTFGELAARREVDLRVVATDVSTHLPVVFSAAATPDMQVAEAVRMSMSIPFFFASVTYAGNLYVDGGATWNYPIEIFDDATPNEATLGLRFESLTATPRPPAHVGNIVELAKSLYEAVSMVQTDFYRRSSADLHRTVVIDDLGIQATDFGITRAQKEALLANGRKATTAYLQAHPPTSGG